MQNLKVNKTQNPILNLANFEFSTVTFNFEI